MKKFVSLAISCVLAFGAVAGFAACGGGDEDPPHTHTYAKTWSYDSENHWREATCPDGVEMELFTDKAAHGTPGADGKCPTCGYKIKATMTLAQFKERANYQTEIRNYARKLTTNTDMATVGQEFVWVKTDSNNWLTSLSYIFVAPKGATAAADAKSHNLNIYKDTTLEVDLSDVAAGTASAGYPNFTSTINFEQSEQSAADRQALADAVVEAYKAQRKDSDYDPTYTEADRLLRVCTITYNTGTTISSVRIVVYDILETGYVYYSILDIPTTAKKTDAELTAQLNSTIEGAKYRANNSNENLGELLYKPAN